MKRAFDLVVAGASIVLLAPLLLLIAVWIKVDSRGPVLFRQERVGRGGRLFRIHKFRTMVQNAPALGPAITVGGDQRITRAGEFLRRTKLDELPQLIDVLEGDMSLVGPRPEVPEYVAHWPSQIRDVVLSVRPGITEDSSIEFIDESALLVGEADPDRAYIEQILPRKLALYVQYVQSRTLGKDIRILLSTVMSVLRGGAANHGRGLAPGDRTPQVAPTRQVR